MIRKIAVIALLSAFFSSALSQELVQKKSKARPDLPGTFTLEYGFNFPSKAPNEFSTGFWGSRTLNLYYQYELRILKSKFSFVPGIGFSLERYKFKNDSTLAMINGQVTVVRPGVLGYSGVRKSQLITNYFEVPVELVFRTNPDDPARSFKISVGARAGFLFNSFTKLKYKDDGEVRKTKDKQSFDLSKFRYALTAKVGIGNFALFGYYNLNPLFESGKGLIENTKEVEFSTFTIGVSLASF